MRIPEPLKVCASRFLDGCADHEHESNEHDPACPGWACEETSPKKAREALPVLCRELGDVVQVGDCVDPREEDDCPCDH